MWPFPKVYFSWREPKGFRRALAAVHTANERWWHNLAGGFVLACLLMTVWALAKLDPKKQPPPFELAIAFALPTGTSLLYVLSWVHRVAPSTVSLMDDRMIRLISRSRLDFKYGNVESFVLHDYDTFRVLVLGLRTGRTWPLGVPVDMDMSAVEDFLVDRGLRKLPPNSGGRPFS
jgi:hypothetical protein